MQDTQSHRAQVTIGLDVGGTKSHATAFDDELRPIADFREPTRTGNGDVVERSVIATVAALAKKLNGTQISRIGIGVPGLVDQTNGSVRHAVNLGIGDDPAPLGPALANAYGVPCSIDNDVNVAALGAHHLLQEAHNAPDLAYLSIGTGISAGIILNGRPHRGRRGVAGEIGHFPVEPGGPQCECGLTGCLETVASGSAISRQWPTANGQDSAQALLQAANSGDSEAIAVLDRLADRLARGIYLLAVSYDVDLIVIGGGVSDLGPPLLGHIRTGLRRLGSASAFVKSLKLQERVILKPAGAVGSIGAAVLSRSDCTT
jgi:glucokinase